WRRRRSGASPARRRATRRPRRSGRRRAPRRDGGTRRAAPPRRRTPPGRGRGARRQRAGASAEVAARDADVARGGVARLLRRRVLLLVGMRLGDLEAALTELREAVRQVDQLLGDDVDDDALALQLPGAGDEAGAEDDAAE